ncbi:hypothetical protein [Enterococcus sp. CWB-B31]|uniref:hypothetical protein n=1 Tax=Enterococcus sp. CWB-B31 TaxID=2885159 RepID=UPI001E42CFB6|nr:hypothetical protein [Enterococcus sp. CWB-B31]MCB5953670.1 hypothetical protein [Enterococcus sp. CWB-B31]
MNRINKIYKEAVELNTRLTASLDTLNSYVSENSIDGFFSFRSDENNRLSLSCEVEKIVDEEDGITEYEYYVVLFHEEASLQAFLNMDRSSMIDYIIFNAT